MNEKKATMVIVDGDNIFTALKNKSLRVINLKAMIESIIGKIDSQQYIQNLVERSYSPIILIVTARDVDKGEHEQNLYLGEIKKSSEGLVDIIVLKSKKSNQNVESVTDMDIGIFFTIALYNDNIDNIVIVSGDGDFLRAPRWAGVPKEKNISLVCVNGTESVNFKNYILQRGGEVFIIEGKTLRVIYQNGQVRNSRNQIQGLELIKKSPKKRKPRKKSRKKTNGNGSGENNNKGRK